MDWYPREHEIKTSTERFGPRIKEDLRKDCLEESGNGEERAGS